MRIILTATAFLALARARGLPELNINPAEVTVSGKEVILVKAGHPLACYKSRIGSTLMEFCECMYCRAEIPLAQ